MVDCQPHKKGLLVRTRIGQDGLIAKHHHTSIHTKGANNEYEVQKVVLAIGKRVFPRKLNIGGKDLPHVYNRYTPVEEKRYIVIGGGESAVETALRLSKQKKYGSAQSSKQRIFSTKKEKYFCNLLGLFHRPHPRTTKPNSE
jgi:cation diffusion facilitator CzcD-associated flavoprotein CzcO